MSPEAPPPLEIRQPQKERDPLLTKPRQAGFLAAYRKCGNVTIAAKAAEIDRTTHYDWMKNDPEYVDLFRSAHEEAIDLLEFEAMRRASKGVVRPIMFGGKQVRLQDPKYPDDETKTIPGVMREYSDTLLMFLLNGARPWKYLKRFQVSGNINETKTNHEIRESIHRIAIDADGLRALELIADMQLKQEGAAPVGAVALLESPGAQPDAEGAAPAEPAGQPDEPTTLGRVPGPDGEAAGESDESGRAP